MHFLGHNVKLLLVLTLNKQCEEYSSGVLKSSIAVLLHLGRREELGSMEVCIAFVPPQDLFCYCHFSRQFLCQLGFLCCYTFSSTWDRDFVYFLSRVFFSIPTVKGLGLKSEAWISALKQIQPKNLKAKKTGQKIYEKLCILAGCIFCFQEDNSQSLRGCFCILENRC